MARGPSGRLVADFDPLLKREFHAALAADGTNFKEWLLVRVQDYLDNRLQPQFPTIVAGDNSADTLPLAAEEPGIYKTPSTRS